MLKRIYSFFHIIFNMFSVCFVERITTRKRHRHSSEPLLNHVHAVGRPEKTLQHFKHIKEKFKSFLKKTNLDIICPPVNKIVAGKPYDNLNHKILPAKAKNHHSTGTSKRYLRPCIKFSLGFFVFVILFFLCIIFVVSRRDKPLRFKIYHDGRKLPVISQDTYYKTKESENGGGKNAEVPKIFHQLWKNTKIPPKWSASNRKCLELNKGYKFILWTDEMIYNLIAIHYPWFYNVFVGYPYHIQRVDVARYFILYHYGGVYLDIDATCKVPFDKIISQMKNNEHALMPRTDIHGVTNSFMVAKLNSPFFKYVTYELPSYSKGHYTIIRHTMIIFSTGPMFLSHCVDTFTSLQDIHILSIEDYDEKYFSHAKAGSWHSWDTEIIDIFHFHYIGLVIILMLVLCLLYFYYYRRCYCCCNCCFRSVSVTV